jgi:hypothetical protein
LYPHDYIDWRHQDNIQRGPPESLGGQVEVKDFNGALWCRIDDAQDAKEEILVETKE